LNAEQRREVAAWFAQHRDELPEVVRAFLELHQTYLATSGNVRKPFDAALRELRRALGITPSSEKRPSGSPLGALSRAKLGPAKSKRQRAEELDGAYFLKTSRKDLDAEEIWRTYMVLSRVEAAFRDLKRTLDMRPVFHRKEARVETHIFVAFLAYCLTATLAQRLKVYAPGLTPRAVLDKLSGIQMIDVKLPTTDGRLLVMPRYTQPEADQQMLRLQEELTTTENKISFARQFYNDSVMIYNTKIQSVPSNIIAGMFNFKEEKSFELDNPAEKEVPNVSFS